MAHLRASVLSKIMAGIAVTAPLAAIASTAACGSSSTDVDQDRTGCGGTTTFTVPLVERICEAGAPEGGAGDSGSEAGTAPVCEAEAQFCERACGRKVDQCLVLPGATEMTCRVNAAPCGRAHAGLLPMPADAGLSPVASWLAEAAYLEDASVTSFEILARELEAHDAPSHLVIAAKRSARDEVRHSRVMSALAQRHGARVPRATKQCRAPRALEAILLENAIEGCVHETYGAQLAWYQAANATDPKVRAAMRRIAADETRHAALAWQIAAWAETRSDLDAATRAAIASGRARALAALEASLSLGPDEAAAGPLGLPDAATARAMLHALTAQLEGLTDRSAVNPS